ncbi:hypothetical protein BX666DRAFT_1963600 [Dichotomocladium elegans]|nr:hypothetical protein BX666DRAFT_1963600 [Dichotomocladium elegans]
MQTLWRKGCFVGPFLDAAAVCVYGQPKQSFIWAPLLLTPPHSLLGRDDALLAFFSMNMYAHDHGHYGHRFFYCCCSFLSSKRNLTGYDQCVPLPRHSEQIPETTVTLNARISQRIEMAAKVIYGHNFFSFFNAQSQNVIFTHILITSLMPFIGLGGGGGGGGRGGWKLLIRKWLLLLFLLVDY